jgi:hypothetical protein
MRWNYDPSATNLGSRKVLDWYREKGLRVMGATSASTGGDLFLPRGDSRAKIIQDFSKLAVEKDLVGIFTTNWDDISSHSSTVERGYAAQGEFGWNPTARDVKQFIEAHAQREWSLSYVDAAKFITNLEKSAPIVETALTKGRNRRTAPLDLPDPKNAGAWNRQYAHKLNKMRELAALCKDTATEIKTAQQYARRNRFTLEVYAATNEFFAFSPRILLALEKYDATASDEEKRAALKEVLAVCEDFKNIRERVESTYGKTRYMNNPPGYQLDQNHHNHLAAVTNNSDWFFISEIAFITKIRNWAKKQN